MIRYTIARNWMTDNDYSHDHDAHSLDDRNLDNACDDDCCVWHGVDVIFRNAGYRAAHDLVCDPCHDDPHAVLHGAPFASHAADYNVVVICHGYSPPVLALMQAS